jgi:hypothetical protein
MASMSENKETINLSRLKSIIEDILRNSFGMNTLTTASRFINKLSIFPKIVDSHSVNSETLFRLCRTLSIELQDKLIKQGINAKISSSNHPDNNAHNYVVVGEIIIDPSIGYFLEGHNHVFIGTRKELKDLVMSETYEIIHSKSKNDPELFFERTWGTDYIAKTFKKRARFRIV